MGLNQGVVAAIFVADKRHELQQEVAEVRVVMGKGIVGDRYFGATQRYPGQNLTLIEFEEIERFNAVFGLNIPLHATRRNIITRGVRLNELVGKEFMLGGILLRGVELCEPCKTLGTNLSSTAVTSAQVVAAFVRRGGLRADVLGTGVVRVGDVIG